ncbi:MAG: translesion DNA synthesis-associated protein ImuA [Woeseiaceae bacterium]
MQKKKRYRPPYKSPSTTSDGSLIDPLKTPEDPTGVFFSSTDSLALDDDPLDQLNRADTEAAALTSTADQQSLDALLAAADIWRANELSAGNGSVFSTGFSSLDALLPGGGWPVCGLTELLNPRHGIGELRLFMPGLARLAAAKAGWIIWINPPYLPNAPALMQWGISPDRILLVHPKSPADAAWAAEQALGSDTCVAMLLWGHALDSTHDLSAGRRKRRLSMQQFSRRLQLAATSHQCWAIVLRDCAAEKQPSAAMLRLMLTTEQGRRDLHILKMRGGQPAVVPDFDDGIDVDAMMLAADTFNDSSKA